MLRELMSIFRSNNPLAKMGENFSKMLKLTDQMTAQAGRFFFDKPATPDERTQIYKQDVKVNKTERRVRKQVITHLSIGGNSADALYCPVSRPSGTMPTCSRTTRTLSTPGT